MKSITLRLQKTYRALMISGMSLVAAVGLAVAGFTGSASAISPCSVTPGAVVCLWTNINYSGSGYSWTIITIGQCYNLYGTFQDSVSSVQNNVGKVLRLYRDGNCTGGSYWPVSAYQHVSCLCEFNDVTTSIKLIP